MGGGERHCFHGDGEEEKKDGRIVGKVILCSKYACGVPLELYYAIVFRWRSLSHLGLLSKDLHDSSKAEKPLLPFFNGDYGCCLHSHLPHCFRSTLTIDIRIGKYIDFFYGCFFPASIPLHKSYPEEKPVWNHLCSPRFEL